MPESPTSMICFNESKIKRVILNRALSTDELKNHRIRIGTELMKDYDPAKHEFEIIRKDKEN